jgi:oligoribonuclease
MNEWCQEHHGKSGLVDAVRRSRVTMEEAEESTVGELCSRWYRKEHNKAPRKKGNHTAMSDIRESIEQLKYYKSAIFK